eukprot:3517421-Pleurochrysis_carterae.AAC.1
MRHPRVPFPAVRAPGALECPPCPREPVRVRDRGVLACLSPQSALCECHPPRPRPRQRVRHRG